MCMEECNTCGFESGDPVHGLGSTYSHADNAVVAQHADVRGRHRIVINGRTRHGEVVFVRAKCNIAAGPGQVTPLGQRQAGSQNGFSRLLKFHCNYQRGVEIQPNGVGRRVSSVDGGKMGKVNEG